MGALGNATIKTSVVTCVVRCGDRQAFRAGLLSLAAGRRGRREQHRDMVMPRTTKMITTRTTSITRVTTHSHRRRRRGMGGGDNNDNDYDYCEYRDEEKDATRRRRTTKRGGGGGGGI